MMAADVPTAAEPLIARVMVCDNSAVSRAALTRILESDPGVRVVARAGNGRQALDELQRTAVDVVLLDIEMPVMDGLAALPELLRISPGVRVIMASTLTTLGAEASLRAFRLGAADCVAKPSALTALGAEAFRRELLDKVKGLAQPLRSVAPTHGLALRPAAGQRPELLAVGASTGGPQALFTLIQGLGRDVPVPVVVTQHMPPIFTAILAEHVNRLGVLPCSEAADGETLAPGRIHLAPGDRHLLLQSSGGAMRARLLDGPPVNYCRPSVDPMLESAADACGGRVLVAMLTGMGQDGLAGTRRVIEAGGTAIAQDEASSVVWGMPGAVAQAGLCHAVLPLDRIAPRLLALLHGWRT